MYLVKTVIKSWERYIISSQNNLNLKYMYYIAYSKLCSVTAERVSNLWLSLHKIPSRTVLHGSKDLSYVTPTYLNCCDLIFQISLFFKTASMIKRLILEHVLMWFIL